MDEPQSGKAKTPIPLGTKLFLILGPIALVGMAWVSIKINDAFSRGMQDTGLKVIRALERRSTRSEAQKGAAREAEAKATLELKADPTNSTARWNRAEARHTLGDLGPAAQDWRHYLETFPDDVYARYKLGEILDELGDEDRSRREFQRLAHMPVKLPEERFYRASALEYLGKAGEALVEFRTLLEEAPADWPKEWRKATTARIQRLEALR